MRIVILGAGFCGLATAWHLSQKRIYEIVLVDPLGIGRGASGVAAGLLHLYAGSQAKKSLRADSGLAATLKLIAVAEATLGIPVVLSKGLIRLAISDKQKADFAISASLYPDIHWLPAEACQKKLGINESHPGIFIDSAVVVDCEKYLKGLWTACSNAGVTFEKKGIQSLEEVRHFDRIIVTMGAAAKKLPELSEIKLTPVKGQVLELNWPKALPAPLFPISSQAYIIMKEGNKNCIVGATYEKNFHTESPDIEIALREIMPKLHSFLPELNSELVIGCRSGVRASCARHQPLMEKIDEKTWLLTGMGSKGLLYHALYAEELVHCLECV